MLPIPSQAESFELISLILLCSRAMDVIKKQAAAFKKHLFSLRNSNSVALLLLI
jgi:hypothetical protein